MNKIVKYSFSDLYEMASGISTKKEQAGHGSPFASFGTVFNNYFLPDELPDLMDTSEREQEIYSIKENDVLVTRTSETIDELAMSCVALKDYPKATYSGFTKRLRPKKEGIVYSKYLAFYLRGELFRKAVTNNAFMTLRASFNEDIFSFLDLYLPEYKEQVKIGDLLYLIEKKIQINKRINDNLLQLATDIYDFWFAQFNYPNHQNLPYKSSGGAMYWNNYLNRLVSAEISDISVGDITICHDSKRIPLSNNERLKMQGNIPYYGATGIMDYVDTHIFEGDYLLLAEDGSVMTSRGTPILQRIHGKTWVNNHAHVLEPVEGYSCLLLYMLLKDIPVVQIKTGSIQYKINQENLNNYHVLNVPEYLRKLYIEKTSSIEQKILELRTETQDLIHLRDWLLPMLMNGQATIND